MYTPPHRKRHALPTVLLDKRYIDIDIDIDI